MRAIPGMTVICPADAGASGEKAILAAAEHQGPVYIRLGMAVPKVHGSDYRFEIGKAIPMRTEGRDAAIIANGIMLSRALDAAEQLGHRGHSRRRLARFTPSSRLTVTKSSGWPGRPERW